MYKNPIALLILFTFSLSAKTVLIAGGAGFIGTNLSIKLLDMGYKLIVVDNFQTGSKNNLIQFQGNPNFNYLEHDITSPFAINESIDWVINLACPASPIAYQKNPIHTIKTCVDGVINLLEIAKEKGAIFLQASTSEVYGEPLEHPQTESNRGNVNTFGPRACYDEGKRLAETLCFEYHQCFKTKIKIIRIFNTYGPYMNPKDGRVISNFIMQALNKEKITLYGDGSQTRSFCYIDDLVDGTIAMLNSDKSITGPVNLGNPEECSIKELARTINRMTNNPSTLTYKPLPIDDPSRRQPDISQAQELLKWAPKISLKEGLNKTITYFSNNFSIGSISARKFAYS